MVLSCINGYKIPFDYTPMQKGMPAERNWSVDDKLNVSSLLSELQNKGAITTGDFVWGQFTSDIFLIEKPNGKNRLIINLKKLNEFLSPPHFKLEDSRTVKKLLKQDCFMSSLDLQDTYYLISVRKSFRKYLRFLFNGQLYELTCLPFGLSTAHIYKNYKASCSVFTKIRIPVSSLLGW